MALKCYNCGTIVTKEHLNLAKDGLLCPNCEKLTVLEGKDFVAFGLKQPTKQTDEDNEVG